MDASGAALDPVVLSGWPSCTDCLSWSSDGDLAVAVGEFIHILTPKRASISDSKTGPAIIGLRQWDSARVRTNVFEQREWPDQTFAPSHSLSLGEEQSLSTVVQLAWSPPGIGPHARNVLAVLTSNQILSLWESNGEIGDWKRVFVVNHALGDYFEGDKEAGEDIGREKKRIRAFAWSPPYQSIQAEDGQLSTSSWGVVHLAVADDDEDVIIFRVAKLRKEGHIEWSLKMIDRIDLPAGPTDDEVLEGGSLFHKAMTRKCPVLSLSWSNLEGQSFASFIQVAQYRQSCSIKVHPSLDPSQEDPSESLGDNLVLTSSLIQESRKNSYHDASDENVTENAELDKGVEEARLEFDSHYGLDGNSIVRKWGQASHATQEAACITIHPSDMVEYTTPSMEKCTLVFAVRTNPNCSPTPLKESSTSTGPHDVLLAVAGWMLSTANDVSLLMPIDRQLIGIFATYAAQSSDELLRQQAKSVFSRLRQTLNLLPNQEDLDVSEVPPVGSLSASDVETCLICRSRIPFDENNIGKVRCETGHQYTRCNLSLLAIQEPGISKYCSQCDRQFLKAEELEIDQKQESSGPSLTALLFEKFDVCPYCHAKYRG